MNVLRRIAALLAFLAVLMAAFLAVLMAAVVAAAKWAEGGTLAWWEWSLACALPGLVVLYLRYFSVIGCRHGSCLDPPARPTPDPPLPPPPRPAVGGVVGPRRS